MASALFLTTVPAQGVQHEALQIAESYVTAMARCNAAACLQLVCKLLVHCFAHMPSSSLYAGLCHIGQANVQHMPALELPHHTYPACHASP